MYIDYNGYNYPKALFSQIKLTFPDELGNPLSSILLHKTSYRGGNREGEDNCIYWCMNKSKLFKYDTEEIFNWLTTWTYIKDKKGNILPIIEKYVVDNKNNMYII